MTDASPDELYQRAKAALRRGLETCRGRVSFDQHGLASDLEDNLVSGVTPSLFEADLQADGGEEMHGEMRAPHASSALAANAFSPWRADPRLLRFADRQGFATFKFEQQLPSGFGGVPAYFDTFATVGGKDLSSAASIGDELCKQGKDHETSALWTKGRGAARRPG